MVASSFSTFSILGFEDIEINMEDLDFNFDDIPIEGIHPILLPFPHVKLSVEDLSHRD